ncbi:hypothetical protein HPP92_023537 [Vanilla planifolia]|uniref:Uncharacterized protein n=1 Tax=Vanilla planifolia TaxID=51239 RepID=A0A835PLY8_VANPL|nr:hypothetical protein HPP92_023537 [Vanilla planifolia]
MVRSFIERSDEFMQKYDMKMLKWFFFNLQPNCIILAISPANQDLATSDAIKIAREVDPKGERTFGVLTKIDLMDKGTDAVAILEGKSYRLQYPWVGVVNRSQADINKNVDMIAARRREREYFATSPDYKHLAQRMGSEYLGKMLSKHLESVIKSRIPGLQSLVGKTIAELEAELSRLGKRLLQMPVRPGGERIYNVFDNQLPAALKRLQFDKQLSMENVRKLITEADGYQPHLIAPEQGYRRLIESSLVSIRGPAEAAVDAVHGILKELVHKAIRETAELRQYPTLRSELPDGGFLPKLPQDVEKGGNPTHSIFDRYNDIYLRRIGSNVLAYVNMVSAKKLCVTSIRNPSFTVKCARQKRSLLDHFFTEIGKKELKELSNLLNEDPAVMERRAALAKRLELYRNAQSEIDSVAWSK